MAITRNNTSSDLPKRVAQDSQADPSQCEGPERDVVCFRVLDLYFRYTPRDLVQPVTGIKCIGRPQLHSSYNLLSSIRIPLHPQRTLFTMPALNHSGSILDEVSDAVDDGEPGLGLLCSLLTDPLYRFISQRSQREALERGVRVR